MVSIESDGGGGSEVIALVIILKGTVFESGRPAASQTIITILRIGQGKAGGIQDGDREKFGLQVGS